MPISGRPLGAFPTSPFARYRFSRERVRREGAAKLWLCFVAQSKRGHLKIAPFRGFKSPHVANVVVRVFSLKPCGPPRAPPPARAGSFKGGERSFAATRRGDGVRRERRGNRRSRCTASDQA